MTISLREKLVLTRLPAARLYLEDIGEIVRVLLEAPRDREQRLGLVEKDDQTQITFCIGDTVCDDIQDLPKIAKRPRDFELRVSKGKLGYSASFGADRYLTQWTTSGLTKEEALVAQNNLLALFERRKLPWRNLLHSHLQWSHRLYGAASGLLYILFLSLLFGNMRQKAAVMIALAAVAILTIALRTGLKRHSIVILRNSWEQTALREDRNRQILIGVVYTVIGVVLGIGGTLLAVYLQHKYWH